jgi:ElaA protein
MVWWFMEIIVKHFKELTLDELYEILKIRAEVFVVEQNCAYQDLDDIDQDCYHVYMLEEDKMVGYLRVIDKEKRLDEVSLGRVISLKRRCGVGTALMKAGIAVAKEKYGATKVKIGAQLYAKPFYEQVGFCQISGEYLEDGIPHIYMIYED